MTRDGQEPPFSTLVSVLALSAAFASSGLAQEDGQTLRVGVAQGLVALDPHTSSLYSDVRVLQQIYRGLLQTDPETLAPVPDMAESWDVSEDKLTWTFRLRPDLTFHDGSPLTASDVRHSLERIRDEATGATLRSDLAPVAEVMAPDDLTVVIRLSQPYGILPSVLATPVWAAIVPEDVPDLVAQPIGSGPFRFVGQVERTSVSLDRFDGFHDPERPRLDAVEFVVVPDESARVAALLSGQVDLIDSVSLPLAGRVEQAAGVSLLAYESAWVDEFGMNTQRPPSTTRACAAPSPWPSTRRPLRKPRPSDGERWPTR
jgi:peptide/nickel transport system substrate-binding protein